MRTDNGTKVINSVSAKLFINLGIIYQKYCSDITQ